MGKEYARALVHLADDDPLGAVDDERARVGHQGQLTQVDILFLDVVDVFGLTVRIFLPDDQAQGYAQRSGKRNAPDAALVHGILGIAQSIVDVLQRRRAAEIRNRENRAEYRFQSLVFSLVRWGVFLQESIIGI